MITAAEWYDSNPDPTSFWQGDIVKDVPLFVFPNFNPAREEGKWATLRPLNPQKDTVSKTLTERMQRLPVNLKSQTAKTCPDWWQDPEGEYFVAHARRMAGMIINRSCSIPRVDNLKHFLVAPVTRVKDLHPDQQKEECMGLVRVYDCFDWFYLPATDGLEESVADLSLISPVHRTFFGDKPSAKTFVASLTSRARSKLQEMISDSYGTIFGFDHKDKSPQNAEYRCASCFYVGSNHIERRHVREGDVIGPCPNCGESVTWAKMPESETPDIPSL